MAASSPNLTDADLSTNFERVRAIANEFVSNGDNSLLFSMCEEVKSLTSAFTQASNREKICERHIVILEHLLSILQNKSPSASTVNVITEMFRTLRNICADNECNQNLVTQKSAVFIRSLVILLELLETNSQDETVLCLRCGIQFWGNLIVNNSSNKNQLWTSINAHFRKFLDKTKDRAVLNYSCMVLCNCFRNEKDIVRDFIAEPLLFSTICSRLVEVTMEYDLEWGLYTIQLLLTANDFLEKLSEFVIGEAWLFILEIIQQLMDSPEGDSLSRSNILFLARELKKKSDYILKLESAIHDETHSISLLKTLEILCAITATDSRRLILQDDLDLLATATWLLKSTHLVGKNAMNNFSPVVDLTSAAFPEKLDPSPADGLKRDLIRLIGNLCYRSQKNQNHFREMDAIPLLLDCCNLDARNPYLIQWVILAIRNLCEDNPENCALISAMESKGKIDKNVSAQIDSLHRNDSLTTPMERNRDDIDDLFS